MNLRFVSALALRELRAQPARLGLHALSIAVGVAALVAVSNLRLALQRSVVEQATYRRAPHGSWLPVA